jgi:N-acetylneuraminic acid mutarotase
MSHLQTLVALIVLTGEPKVPDFQWKQLADLNDPRGFAGQFVGVSNGRLLLYGGTNFPDKPVWDGGAKGWYRDVFVLDDLGAQWKKLGPLPGERAVGYGVSLPYEDGFLCIGGADAEKHVTDCFVISYDGRELKTRDLPKLPRACAYLSGAQVGDVIYVAGGIDKPDAVKTMRTFWALDLKHLDAGWKELEPWPGLPRMLAVAASHDGAFYLMSGVDLFPDALGKPMRIYHRDAFRYRPGEGWTKLADVPTPIVAAPNPVMVVDGTIAIFGGDEGRLLGFKPMEKHPGFPKTFWTYDIAADAWKNIGVPPFIPVAVPLVKWKDGYVAASGEVRPAVRSREVWYVRPAGK